MAREILFKAKRIDNGECVEGLLWKKKYQSNKWFISCFPEKDDNEEVYVIDINTLCQFTGLLDKNGNKIWENDVVEVLREDELFKVEWQEDTARFVMSCDSFIVDYDNYWSHHTEVIGNIFDNPELLGGGE